MAGAACHTGGPARISPGSVFLLLHFQILYLFVLQQQAVTALAHQAQALFSYRQEWCVNTCKGRRDGDFPSCTNCNTYIMCIDGEMFDNSCPLGLKFDFFKMRCARRSRSCKLVSTSTDSMAGPRNLDQRQHLATQRPTPTDDLWRDAEKEEVPEADPAGSPGEECVRECHGLPDGNYQSCKGCNMYASCRQGIIIDGRLCSAGTSWDDNRKKCVNLSATCPITKKNGPRTVPVGACVLECKGLADGLYQSCKGCEYFISCWAGGLEEEGLCHPSGKELLWDDNVKLCLPTSSTCNPGTAAPKVTTVSYDIIVAPGDCVNSCTGVANGNYQSCQGCHVFVTCKNGVIFDGRACAENQVWDDHAKECVQASSTCGATEDTDGFSCVTSCEGVPRGTYQSCLGCHLYVTCNSDGHLTTNACPDNLVWDDDIKICRRQSSTCNYGERNRKPPDGVVTVTDSDVVVTESKTILTTTPSGSTLTPMSSKSPDLDGVIATEKSPEGDVGNTSMVATRVSCISSCENMPDGDYQSCFGCHIYAHCAKEIHVPKSCPRTYSWDESVKKCVENSTTCGPGFGGCVHTCGSLQDGDYQSCRGCHMHLTCFRGATLDGRPCPSGLVWDDLLKWCVKTSSTCRQPTATTSSMQCVTSCEGKPDGDYQSCKGCSVYATCLNGKLQENRPCAPSMKFDNALRKCVKKSLTCGPGHGDCINSCEKLKDGDYKSCSNCSVYATCLSGVLSDNKPCPVNTSWDDIAKRCEVTSMTCADDLGDVTLPEVDTPEGLLNETTGGDQWNFTYVGHVGDGVCVSSCEGKLNGDYQSCQGCNMFATCLNNILYDRRPCPDGLVWEDDIKHCRPTSSTCSPGRGGCVSSCVGLADGEYQSCHGCHVYVSCQGGRLEDDRPCPRGEVWDDQRKRCEKTSVTCPKVDGRAVPPGVCVYSCEDTPDGDYQSCLGCTGYVTCTKGVLHDNRPCPTGLVWDDNKKRCRYTSPTCRPGRGMCTRSCNGLSDGDYQSCNGCHVYVTCLMGEIHDRRPCPRPLVWDDSVKRCMRDSPTCRDGRRRGGGSSEGVLASAMRRPGSRMQAITTRGCVSSCEGMDDGDYQSCKDCRVYVTCSEGVINDDRPCPVRSAFDADHKRCMPTSGTCTAFVVVGTGNGNQGRLPRPLLGVGTVPRHRGHSQNQRRQRVVGPRTENCITSCEGRESGDYQSCLDCRVYATCLFGALHDNRRCPRHTLWDDNAKRCLYDSTTCHLPNHRPHFRRSRRPLSSRISAVPLPAPPPALTRHTHSRNVYELPKPLSCVSSCDRLSDGEYQSCHDCRLYASCRNGVLNDYRPCPANTYWDDRLKRCMQSSSTCSGYRPDLVEPNPRSHSSSHHVTRDHTRGHQRPRTDDRRRHHSGRSGRHQGSDYRRSDCVTSCRDVPDGNYASCIGCSQYVSCIRGTFFGGRSCPSGLFWDDNRKRCDFTSTSCGAADAAYRPVTEQRRNCVTSCAGLADGDYQSCVGCHVFVTCTAGDIEDNKPCPANTLWDDNLKQCLWMSVTCTQ